MRKNAERAAIIKWRQDGNEREEKKDRGGGGALFVTAIILRTRCRKTKTGKLGKAPEKTSAVISSQSSATKRRPKPDREPATSKTTCAR